MCSLYRKIVILSYMDGFMYASLDVSHRPEIYPFSSICNLPAVRHCAAMSFNLESDQMIGCRPPFMTPHIILARATSLTCWLALKLCHLHMSLNWARGICCTSRTFIIDCIESTYAFHLWRPYSSLFSAQRPTFKSSYLIEPGMAICCVTFRHYWSWLYSPTPTLVSNQNLWSHL